MSKVIVFRGKAGVGKTTISDKLGKQLSIPIIRKEDIYDSIAGYVDNHEARNKACYAVLYKIIETNIQNDIDIIVDAGFHYLDQVLPLKNWAISKNACFTSFLCICSDEEIWAERFNKRRVNPKPNNLITDFNELRLHYKDLYTEPIENELILDTVNSIDQLVSAAILEISAKDIN